MTKATFPYPVTIIEVGHGAELTARCDHYRDAEIEVGPYAQHELAITVWARKPRKRKRAGHVISPDDCTPPLCVVLKGKHSPTLTSSGVRTFGLSGDPTGIIRAHRWANGITAKLADEFDVMFDWRDHFDPMASAHQ